mmetsp:Transcript_64550/g.120147  ORF Transcript_64550/g.120147 Transcript_64550/m.120147 type:complete len:287 (+) Transcript_64550:94-954(+)
MQSQSQSYGGGGGTYYGGQGGGVGDAYDGGSVPQYNDNSSYSGFAQSRNQNYQGQGYEQPYEQDYQQSSQQQSSFASVAQGRLFMKEFWVNCLILEAQRDVSSVVTGFLGGMMQGSNYSDVKYVDDVAPVIRQRIRQVVSQELGWECDAQMVFLPPHSGGSRDRWAPTMQIGSQTLMVFRCQLLRRAKGNPLHNIFCCCCDHLCPPNTRVESMLTIQEGVQQVLRNGKPRIKAMVEVTDSGSQASIMAEKGWCSYPSAEQAVERARRERGYGTYGGGGGGRYAGDY